MMVIMRHMIQRRRKKSVTNYKRRLALLKSGIPRLVIRKTNKHIIMEIAEYSPIGDKIITTANSKDLDKLGWVSHSNIPTAYLTGVLLAKKAKEKKFDSNLILDTGLYKPIKNNVIFAGAKGCMDSGLKLNSNIDFDKDRISGKHIEEAAKDKKFKETLTSYKEKKFDVSNMSKLFDEVKIKINGA